MFKLTARKIKVYGYLLKGLVKRSQCKNSRLTLKEKRNPRLIVSLTTFPERFDDVYWAVKSIFAQTLQPDMVVLWLYKGDKASEKLLNLEQEGLTIKYCDKDIKSYKKIIPSLKEFPDDIIVCADDDLYYEKNWLELLYKSYLKNPKAVHCHRMHKITFSQFGEVLPYRKWKKNVSVCDEKSIYFPTSGGGILIPPQSFFKDISDESLFLKLAPNADDIWIWAMLTLKGTNIKLAENNILKLCYINPQREFGFEKGLRLFETNKIGGNDVQFASVLEHYPKIKEIITEKIPI